MKRKTRPGAADGSTGSSRKMVAGEIDSETHEAMLRFARKRGVSFSYVLRAATDEYVRRRRAS